MATKNKNKTKIKASDKIEEHLCNEAADSSRNFIRLLCEAIQTLPKYGKAEEGHKIILEQSLLTSFVKAQNAFIKHAIYCAISQMLPTSK